MILGNKFQEYIMNIFLRFISPSVIRAHTFCRNFRALVAGAGTNGGVPYLGEQLNHTESEIIYIDFSSTSMYIAQERMKIRGLSNIIWAVDWIENINRLGLGEFDFVGSTGVLHHLKDPQHGLKCLYDLQTGDGGAAFMVYGRYGRIGLYQVQELLRVTCQVNCTIDKELKMDCPGTCFIVVISS